MPESRGLLDRFLKAIRSDPADRRAETRHPAVEREVWVGARLGVEGAQRRTGLPARESGALGGVLDSLASNGLPWYVVGDFAGPKAIRSVAQYLRDHHAIASAFYTSNVEQYLWQQADEAPSFYRNVATLPLDSTSTFIRSIGGGFRYGATGTYPRARLNGRLPSVISSIQELVNAFNSGKLMSYGDVIAMSR